MRVASARRMANGGHWHPDGDSRPKFIPKPEPEAPSIDASAIIERLTRATQPSWLEALAANLGVTRPALEAIGACWCPRSEIIRHQRWEFDRGAWCFPMFNGQGRIVGIRLRNDEGVKRAIFGSKEGVFVPQQRPARVAYIVEGPTDLAAAVSFGLWGIGRPSCRSGVAHTQVTINRLHIDRVVLIADNDQPGIEGAKALARELQVPVASMLLPTKDLRKFRQWGGTRAILDSMEQKLVWRQP